MCGIAGSLGPSGRDSLASARNMAGQLSHRGPDDCGAWSDPVAGVALGHARLSILDLSPLGHQPMESVCGRYVTVYNGELYNHQSLRQELTALGARFRGRSDTEVLLETVSRWGLGAAVRRFNGMWALAIWDRKERSLFLSRDRAGEKPLYYGRFGDIWLFGSELRALTKHPAFTAGIDRDSVELMIRYGFIPAPWTVYKSVKKLPPGATVELRADGSEREPVFYWSAAEAVLEGRRRPFEGTEEQASRAMEVLLLDAVGLRLESDVPLGAFLSGGIDSSIIVALMQKASRTPVKTFTIGHPDPAYDESSAARAVAKHLGTEHAELRVTEKDVLEAVPRMAGVYDEPFADSSQVLTYLISHLARAQVTVSLSGDGGDELFGGYNRHRWAAGPWGPAGAFSGGVGAAAARMLAALPAETIDALYARVSPLLPLRAQQRLPGDKLHKLAAVLRCRTSEEAYGFLLLQWAGLSPVLGASKKRSLELPLAPDGLNEAERMMFWDAVVYLPDDILVKVDRGTMSAGLESRAPFLDHRMIEFAWSLPLEWKVRSGVGKRLLRSVLFRHVPRALTERPKMGFAAPISVWLRGPLRDWAEALLERKRLETQGFFNAAVVRAAFEAHLSGRRDAHRALWPVLMYQAWLERWHG